MCVRVCAKGIYSLHIHHPTLQSRTADILFGAITVLTVAVRDLLLLFSSFIFYSIQLVLAGHDHTFVHTGQD